jgi:protein gp37
MASIEKPGPLQWHPFSGCTQIDNDCKGCWARKPAVMDRAELALPQSWSYRHFVHVGNYSDIFLESFSDKSVLEVFATMNNTPLSEFMVQTKNSERLLRLSKKISWTENIWMGVTVTNKHTLSRIDHLRDTGAKIKWVGFTP